ncbi:MAG: acetoin utilization protein AcuC [Rhodospirillales bacterium]|jgi:acetoin utilization protein AcuC
MNNGKNGPFFIGGEIFREAAYGSNHPLTIPRVETVMDLCRSLGWLKQDNFQKSPKASRDDLLSFHSVDYINAVKRSSNAQTVDAGTKLKHDLGTLENPIFPNLFDRATTSAGGTLSAVDLVINGGIAVNFPGGTHHAKSDRASGFCYFNDAVLAIRKAQSSGIERIFYLDLDAHHGDGVEEAFKDDENVFTLSLHEENRWPYSGGEVFGGSISAMNLAVPAGFNDSEFEYLIANVVHPTIAKFSPDLLLINCGADCLAGDPLSKMELSNAVLWQQIKELITHTSRTILVGGGGYNPWTVARYWTGLWGVVSDRELPKFLPQDCLEILKALECDLIDEDDIQDDWITALVDMPNSGSVRGEVKTLAHAASTELLTTRKIA